MYQDINRVNQIILSCQTQQDAPVKDKEEKNTEQSTQYQEASQLKNKEELLYFGRFILILAIVASFLKEDKK